MTISLHDKYCKEAMGFPQTGVQHFHKNALEFTVVDGELLMSLQLGEVLLIDSRGRVFE